MTVKKEQILQKALELFASEGYQNTSTSRIASEAGVSEGLVFKHFKSKDGLLCAVRNSANEDIKGFIKRMKQQDSPRKVIETAFEFPPLVRSNRNFWKLQFSLKYQCPQKNEYHEKHELIEAFQTMLKKAFAALDYENPEMETQLLMNIIRDLCQKNCDGDGCQEQFVSFVKQKYGV